MTGVQTCALPISVAVDKLDGALATIAGGNVAMAGWLQGLTTNSPLSKEASWRAAVIWAVLVTAETAGGGRGGLRGAVVLVGEGWLALAQSGKQQPD